MSLEYEKLQHINALQSLRKTVTIREYHTRERAVMARNAEAFRLQNENRLNEFKIYYITRKNFSRSNKLDKRLDQIPLADILQAIRLAMLENAECEQTYKLTCAYKNEVIAAAKRAVRKLCSQFGYCGNREAKLICSYTDADLEQFHSQSSQDSFPLAKKIIDYYDTHTVRETCEQFGIEFNKKTIRAFQNYYPKHTSNHKPTKTPEERREAQLRAMQNWREKRKVNPHVIEQQNTQSI